MPVLEFWFEYASTYSHIAAQTIEQRAADAGVEIAWRPFLLGPVFMAQGWNDSPFNIYKAKGAYMWRDMERESERHSVAFRRPSAFPRNGLLAARVTAALDGDTRQAGFVRAVYQANFVEDREISDPAIVADCLASAGHDDSAAALQAAGTQPVKDLLRQRTEEAMELGIFGAPSFRTGGELFWGADRLDRALEWGRRG